MLMDFGPRAVSRGSLKGPRWQVINSQIAAADAPELTDENFHTISIFPKREPVWIGGMDLIKEVRLYFTGEIKSAGKGFNKSDPASQRFKLFFT
jgi:hypothetical protein